jgi:hypothetical protein
VNLNPDQPPRSLDLSSSRLAHLAIMLVWLAAACLYPDCLRAAPAFVQGAYAVPQTPQTTVAVTYSAAQAAGNLNVVVVGWNDTSNSVSSVTDSEGNTYQLAVGPTKQSSSLSQSIYYAKNIVGGANSVTVQFSGARCLSGYSDP